MRGDSCGGEGQRFVRNVSLFCLQTTSCCPKWGGKLKRAVVLLRCVNYGIITWYLTAELSCEMLLFHKATLFSHTTICQVRGNLYLLFCQGAISRMGMIREGNEVSEQTFQIVPNRSPQGAFCNPVPKAHVYFYFGLSTVEQWLMWQLDWPFLVQLLTGLGGSCWARRPWALWQRNRTWPVLTIYSRVAIISHPLTS